MECLIILFVILCVSGWMAAVSYADYLVAQIRRLLPQPTIQSRPLPHLSLQSLGLPWGYSRWYLSGFLIFVISILLGIINVWVLAIATVGGAIFMTVTLFTDAQQVEQIYRSLPPPPIPRPQNITYQNSAALYARLIGLQGEYAGQTLEFDASSNSITIGRNRDNVLHFKEDSVSRSHARIVCANNKWFIQDQESKTGVYVNGQRIQGGKRIHQHDRIMIGSSEFEFIHS